MAKCTRKLIDAEAAVSVATAALVDTFIERKWTDADDYRFKAVVAMARALDALPDASEGRWEKLRGHAKGYRVVAVAVENQEYIKAIDHILDSMEEIQGAAQPKTIHAERIPVPPHLAEAQRVVIKQAQQAGDGAEQK